jgi:hypothetical protein
LISILSDIIHIPISNLGTAFLECATSSLECLGTVVLC